MLCVTGAESSAQAWRARAEAHPQHMHELRLDAMTAPQQALEQLGTLPPRTVVCCRAERQGGSYRGDETVRLALLRQAQQQGAAWVDVEADVSDAQLAELQRERVLLSWHDYEAGDAETIERALARMRGRSGGLKLAITVTDTAELRALLEVELEQPAVVLAMGAAGLLSRCCYPAFGSRWSYVAAGDAQHTAPGQLSLARAERWGLPHSATLPLLALLGGEQVLCSPGADVYNPLLQARRAPMLYLPLVTRQLEATLALMRHIGGVGASVTMPLKRDALALCHPDTLAAEVGAVNSLRWRQDRWHGTNTDVAGVTEPLQRAFCQLDAPPKRALILGAGGAAAAALTAVQRLGLSATIAARNIAAAKQQLGLSATGAACNTDSAKQKLGLSATSAGDPGTVEQQPGRSAPATARNTGATQQQRHTEVIAWGQRAEPPHEVLINTTPSGGEQSPWPAEQPMRAQVVLDMGLTSGTRLLDDARAAKAIAISGYDMWLAQGAAQMSWMLGEPIDEAALRSHLEQDVL